MHEKFHIPDHPFDVECGKHVPRISTLNLVNTSGDISTQDLAQFYSIDPKALSSEAAEGYYRLLMHEDKAEHLLARGRELCIINNCLWYLSSGLTSPLLTYLP